MRNALQLLKGAKTGEEEEEEEEQAHGGSGGSQASLPF